MIYVAMTSELTYARRAKNAALNSVSLKIQKCSQIELQIRTNVIQANQALNPYVYAIHDSRTKTELKITCKHWSTSTQTRESTDRMNT